MTIYTQLSFNKDLHDSVQDELHELDDNWD